MSYGSMVTRVEHRDTLPSSVTSLERKPGSLSSSGSQSRRRRRGSDVLYLAKLQTYTLFDLSADPGSDILLEMEQRDLQNETRWLLTDEWNQLIEQLQCQMHHGLRMLKEGVDGKGEETLALSSPNTEALKGVVRISEGFIHKADLTVRLPHYDHGKAFHLVISPHRTYPLPQVQLIKDRMDLIVGLLEGLPAPRDLTRGSELVDNLLEHMKSALRTLTGAGTFRFPDRVTDPDDFVGKLSPRLNVEMYIDGGDLICATRYLKFHSSRPGGYRSLIHGWVDPPVTIPYHDQFVEIVDETIVRSLIPSISSVWSCLEEAASLCETTKEKLCHIRDCL